MGKALYRTYRSRSLGEIVGQDHITNTLQNALQSGKIAHAYLLTGPRGVGKTSVARILAHEVNGLDYSEDPHLDIIEIDAASNNGVEDVRELRDNIMSAPASAIYKVFIIDEVHMLSKAAFNALLKTLEEPPAHVIFILATTEAHKLPETIISRTQRYSFRPVPVDTVVTHLKHIANTEQIRIDDDALALIAAHGDGSFRDSISLLDQASSVSEHITSEDIERLLGHAPGEQIHQLLQGIGEQDVASCLAILHDLFEHGYEPAMVASQLSQRVRALLTDSDKSGPISADRALPLLRDLIDIPASHSPEVLFEIVVMKACGTGAESHAQQPAATKPTQAQANSETSRGNKPSRPATPSAEQNVSRPEETMASQPTQEQADHRAPTEIEQVTSEVTSTNKPDSNDELWQTVLTELKQTHNTLYGVARMAKPALVGNSLELAFSFAFHQKRLNEPKNRSLIADIVEKTYGTPLEIRCVTAEKPSKTDDAPEHVAAISNIFGGAELLES